MKKVFQIIFFLCLPVFLVWNAAFANPANDFAQELEAMVAQEQRDFPQGSLDDIEYVKKILKSMVEADQKVRVKWIEARDYQNPRFVVIQKMDEFHTKKMKEILAKYGW